ncbi:MAG: WhiB family transcriptional regulator [Mycobacteriaceae bacterium]
MKTPCQNEPELWVADHAASRREAATLCRDCPTLNACYEAAITNREKFGVWGGVDFSDERTRPKLTAPLPINHGTDGGYRTHRRRGETPCIACTSAASEASRLRRARQLERAS